MMSEELTEKGIVVKTEKGIAEIELLSNEHCDECSAKLFCKPREDSARILKVTDSSNLNKGDNVSITIAGKSLLIASFNLYLYPLLILVFSIFVGTVLFSSSNNPELNSLALGILLLAIYYFIFFKISTHRSAKNPRVVITKTRLS